MSIRNTAAVSGIIFDLSGTLISNHPEAEHEREKRQCKVVAAFAADNLACNMPAALAERLLSLREEGARLTRRDLVERRAYDTIIRAFSEFGLQTGAGIVDRAECILFEREHEGRQLYPGAREVLKIIRLNQLRLGLITNWSSHKNVTDITSSLGIHECFAPLLSSALFGRIKPHPSIFRSVLQAWNLAPSDVVMVGDSLEDDIAGASAVGMRTVLVEIEPNLNNRRLLHVVRPTYRISDLRALPLVLGLVE